MRLVVVVNESGPLEFHADDGQLEIAVVDTRTAHLHPVGSYSEFMISHGGPLEFETVEGYMARYAWERNAELVDTVFAETEGYEDTRVVASTPLAIRLPSDDNQSVDRDDDDDLPF